jgi:glycolate oxidase FAD binding subunit
VERQARDARDWLQEAGATLVVRLDGADHRALWDAVREFGRALPPHTALVKLTALPTRLPDLIAAAGRAAGGQDAAPQVVAHAGSGVLYAALPGVSLTALRTLIEEARALGGAAVVEGCPPALAGGLDVWGPTRDDFPLMQALKAQFDPTGTLNPGRFLGGI